MKRELEGRALDPRRPSTHFRSAATTERIFGEGSICFPAGPSDPLQRCAAYRDRRLVAMARGQCRVFLDQSVSLLRRNTIFRLVHTAFRPSKSTADLRVYLLLPVVRCYERASLAFETESRSTIRASRTAMAGRVRAKAANSGGMNMAAIRECWFCVCPGLVRRCLSLLDRQ